MWNNIKASKRLAIGILLVVALSLGLSVSRGLHIYRAMQVYLFGYPLVSMGVTKDVMNAPEALSLPMEKRKIGTGPVNQFAHATAFPDHNFRDVVAPNADTLYSIAWLDLKDGPLVLSLPDMQGRWVLMQVMDAWTNAYESLGTRKYGGGKRDYFISGPGWQGEVPEGMVQVKSPTRIGWLVGRTYTRNEADFPAVYKVQAQYHLTPWKTPATTSGPLRSNGTTSNVDLSLAPVKQVARMEVKDYYTAMAAMMVDNPPSAADHDMVGAMASLGIHAGMPLQWDALSAEQQSDLETGLEYSCALLNAFAPGTQKQTHLGSLTLAAVDFLAKRIRQSALTPVNGWAIPMNLGAYGTQYPFRALIALIGLGANTAADAVYPMTSVDANQESLNGAHSYQLHFAKQEIPPSGVFWSLSLYDNESFFVDNPIRRYAIGDRNALQLNADGSLDLWIQEKAPDTDKQANWLPAPHGPFKLIMRIYDPKPEVLNGSWKPPAPRKL